MADIYLPGLPYGYDLAAAIAGATAGDTLWLGPGTYGTGITQFTINKALKIRGTHSWFNSLGAIINGWFKITTAAGVVIHNLEGACIPVTRDGGAGNPDPVTEQPYFIDGSYANISVIGNYIHDYQEAWAWFGSGAGNCYGNVIINCGIISTGLPQVSIYSHNNGGGLRTIQHNVLGPVIQGSVAIQLYSAGNNVQDYDILGNIFSGYGAGLVVDSGALIDDILADSNYFYKAHSQFGSNGSRYIVANGIYINNTWYRTANTNGGIQIWYPDHLDFQYNKIYNLGTSTIYLEYLHENGGSEVLDIHHNSYYYASDSVFYDTAPEHYDTFAQWQARGYDASSTQMNTLPVAEVHCLVNAYFDSLNKEVGKIAVDNYSGAAAVIADLSSLSLRAGYIYRLINAANPAEAVVIQGDDAAAAVIPMTGWTTVAPVGGGTAAADTWPYFFVGILEEIGVPTILDFTATAATANLEFVGDAGYLYGV